MSKQKGAPVDPNLAREAEKYDNPIPSREYITEILEQAKGPMTHEALCDVLGLVDEDSVEALRRRLIAMSRDGQLLSNRKQGYGVINKLDLIRGRVQGHKDGFGFVIPAEGGGDLYLSFKEMRRIFDGDEVLVRETGRDVKGRREGSIVEVLTHNTNQVVGRFFSESGIYFVRPDNPRLSHDVLIAPDDVGKARRGQFVVVEVTTQPGRKNPPAGRILEVLGDHMAPGMEIDVAIRSHGIPHLWPSDVQAEARQLPVEVDEADKTNRIDLRKLPFVTIDGEDARDFDDAVYCETKKSGGWRLYVAIADVSHYVKLGSALDREAQERGTSVYFPDFVVPMLPEALSNGLCSLNPHVDRLSMVCEMTVAESGRVSGYQFYEAVIHSHARLTYTQVGEALAVVAPEKIGVGRKILNKLGLSKKKELPKDSPVAPVLEQVLSLHSLYQTFRVARTARGAIDFETVETRIMFDENRKISQIVPVVRNDAHKLIEECMLAANVCAARFLEKHELPGLYRVHEGPREEKLANLREFLGELGLSLPGSGDEPEPGNYQELLKSIDGRSDSNLIQTVMLRSLSQAMYQPDNKGHFGLAYTAYAHFTSPIRRYPDLLVHRALRHIVRSNVDTKQVKRVEGASTIAKDKIYPYKMADMLAMGERSSLTERRADEATRDVTSWLKCEYLQDHVGDEFVGTVVGVTGFGLFVELKDLYVEGLVHITNLPHDYYHFEAAQHRLVGERTRQVFRLGDELTVKVASVNLDDRKVDLEMVEFKSSSRKAPAAKRGKNAPRPVDTKGNMRKLAQSDDAPGKRKSGGKSGGGAKSGGARSGDESRSGGESRSGNKGRGRGGKTPAKNTSGRRSSGNNSSGKNASAKNASGNASTGNQTRKAKSSKAAPKKPAPKKR